MSRQVGLKDPRSMSLGRQSSFVNCLLGQERKPARVKRQSTRDCNEPPVSKLGTYADKVYRER